MMVTDVELSTSLKLTHWTKTDTLVWWIILVSRWRHWSVWISSL